MQMRGSGLGECILRLPRLTPLALSNVVPQGQRCEGIV